MFNVEKIRKEVEELQREMNRSEKEEQERKQPISTLLNQARGKEVKVVLLDGEIIKGKLKRFSLYELQIDNRLVWKHSIKYLELL
ncbi:MAG: hypothetical protein J7L58_01295 [Thermoplasmata archaeon]|nr:hypothetical protein [Thermoplasmata archaeon]